MKIKRKRKIPTNQPKDKKKDKTKKERKNTKIQENNIAKPQEKN